MYYLISSLSGINEHLSFIFMFSAASMSAMERTELKMAVIAEQLGLSWAGE